MILQLVVTPYSYSHSHLAFPHHLTSCGQLDLQLRQIPLLPEPTCSTCRHFTHTGVAAPPYHGFIQGRYLLPFVPRLPHLPAFLPALLPATTYLPTFPTPCIYPHVCSVDRLYTPTHTCHHTHLPFPFISFLLLSAVWMVLFLVIRTDSPSLPFYYSLYLLGTTYPTLQGSSPQVLPYGPAFATPVH